MKSGEERILIFVRHGDPVIDPEAPSAEWRLSDTGRERAEALRGRVKPFRPAHCYASPEPKARQTARHLVHGAGLAVESLPGLAEQDRAGTPFYSNRTAFLEAVAEVFRHPDRVVLGRESGEAARRRFAEAVRTACRETAGNLVFVTHGTVLALFLGETLGRDGLDLWREMDFCALAAITWPTPRLVEWIPAG